MKQYHQNKFIALICAAVTSLFMLSGCSKTLDDKSEVFDYVEDNIGGLNGFVDSVKNEAEFFDGLLHTDTHPITDSEAAEIVSGLYAVGTINNSLFYEEVDYEFVAQPLSEGIIDSISMYTDYTAEYEFNCQITDEFSEGFYYSESDHALFRGKQYDFKHDGSGFSYKLSNGSEYYTEKICDNWYYFIIKHNTDKS